jgi:hypothetical protein
VAGGPTSSGTLPNLDLFGGATGIQQGFNVNLIFLVPEPSSLALAVLAGVSLLIFRRRRAPNQPPAANPATAVFCHAGCLRRGFAEEDRSAIQQITDLRYELRKPRKT